MANSADQQIPSATVQTSAQVTVQCSGETAFNYISGNNQLSDWLIKCGSVAGAKSVVVLIGPYDKVGATRKVVFVDGSSVQEQLISYSPFTSYAYQVTQFSNFFKFLTGKAYGQLWFNTVNGTTTIKWTYSFTYKNFFAKLFISIFLPLVFHKYIQQALNTAKGKIENSG